MSRPRSCRSAVLRAMMTLAVGLAVREGSAAPPKYTVKLLGTLGESWSEAYGLNNFGDVVGRSRVAPNDDYDSAFLYTASHGMRNLNTLVGRMNIPADLVFGNDHTGDGYPDLYVLSREGDSVVLYDGVTGQFLRDFVTAGSGGLEWPNHCTVGPNGDLFVVSKSAPGNPYTDTVRRYSGVDGHYIGDFVPRLSGGLNRARGIRFGTDITGDGHPDFFAASGELSQVLAYDGVSGAPIGPFVTAGSGGLDQPMGLAFGPDRNSDGVSDLYVASVRSNQVLIYSGADGTFLDVFAVVNSTDIDQMNDIEFGPDGNLYVMCEEVSVIKRFDGATGDLIDTYVPAEEDLSATPFIAFGPDGNLYITSEGGGAPNTVREYQGPTGAQPGALVGIFAASWWLIEATDINDSGEIVGTGFFGPYVNNNLRAFRYSPPLPGEQYGTIIDLEIAPGHDVWARGINNAGDVVGKFIVGSPTYYSFLWRPESGVTTFVNGQNSTEADSIGERDVAGHVQLCGTMFGSKGARAFRYKSSNGSITDLGLIKADKKGNGHSFGSDINTAGTVVGSSTNNGDVAFAAQFPAAGAVQNINGLNAKTSRAYGINDAGRVVGEVKVTNNASTLSGFIYTASEGMTKLQTQINNPPVNLPVLIPRRISQSGMICGTTTLPALVTQKAFLLTPVP